MKTLLLIIAFAFSTTSIAAQRNYCYNPGNAIQPTSTKTVTTQRGLRTHRSSAFPTKNTFTPPRISTKTAQLTGKAS